MKNVNIKTAAVLALALMVQLVAAPDAAHAKWRSQQVPDQRSDDEILTYVVGAGVLVGGYYAYRKLFRKQDPRHPGRARNRKAQRGLAVAGNAPARAVTKADEPPLGRERIDWSRRLGRLTEDSEPHDPRTAPKGLGKLAPDRILIGLDPERQGVAAHLRWVF